MIEFDLANVDNYSDLASQMAPSPFMLKEGITTLPDTMNGSPTSLRRCGGFM
jgi:hypothetical protein